MKIKNRDFFKQNATDLAKKLLGKFICIKNENEIKRFEICETEAYIGENDTACHAHHGKTKRNSVMWEEGGHIYVYLCYGLFYFLNIVSGKKDDPQAVLIRGIDNIFGPGKVGKALKLDKSFYGEDLLTSKRLWLEDGEKKEFIAKKRVGIDYANEVDRNKLWRFQVANQNNKGQ